MIQTLPEAQRTQVIGSKLELYFDVSVWSDEQKSCLSGLLQISVLAPYCKDWEPKYTPTNPSTSDFHDFHPDTPRHPPDILQTPPRHLQGTQDAIRRQHMPTDTARHPWTLTGAVWVCLAMCVCAYRRLLIFLFTGGCLGGVWWVSEGCLSGIHGKQRC